MKRKILTVVLPITLALGVGCSKDVSETKKTDSIKVAEEKQDDGRLKNAHDYKEKVNDVAKEWVNQYQVISDVIAKDPPFATTENEFKTEIGNFKVVTQKMKEIKPPKKYDDLQKELSDAMLMYEDSLTEMVEGLDKGNPETVTQSSKHMDDALKKIKKTIQTIKELKDK
ncbi:DUF7018 domain-containing (lipo)protein [Bacillus wiedmannii]|uniref:DUF7018 domain-containing (lipo)protein n=1 Tax=Bacillus wiedmannii TaxID=1890302 RepID=UPI000BF2A862|nr:hypothetical protein [Bacillus wiedmannii]MDF9664609.1 hypothetical protein [Bacillus wiedmannii]PFZ26926.1 hypothetical protein COL51_13400 [Bacillus wiedmannii]PGC56195.1 hypothetical protein COM22_16475 [Bacillus wiedmannii]PHE70298.1 hypothetical protein COF77_26485 [Bacillus wiedmannii]